MKAVEERSIREQKVVRQYLPPKWMEKVFLHLLLLHTGEPALPELFMEMNGGAVRNYVV